MDQNLMTLLAAVLSGQGKSFTGQQQPAPAQQPMMAAKPAASPMMQPGPQQAVGMRPGEHGNDQPPSVNPGLNDGGGKGGDGGNGGHGGRAGNNQRLSHFERQMRRIGNKGPQAYTKQIEKNLGFKEITPGYGGTNPSSMKTGMATSLANVLTGGPTYPPPPVETGDFPTWPK